MQKGNTALGYTNHF